MQSRETPPTQPPTGTGELATAIQQILAALGALGAQTPSGGAGIQMHLAQAQAQLDAWNKANNPQPPPPPAEERATEAEPEPASENTGSRSGPGRH